MSEKKTAKQKIAELEIEDEKMVIPTITIEMPIHILMSIIGCLEETLRVVNRDRRLQMRLIQFLYKKIGVNYVAPDGFFDDPKPDPKPEKKFRLLSFWKSK